MEQERLAREKEEEEKADKAKKIKEQFGDANSQWEKDKTDMQNLVTQQKKKDTQETAQHTAKAGDALKAREDS
jgi:mannan polymerase II complex ANP1 subunit